MRNKLITALKLTANAIENGTFSYDWRKTESCNCGALACTIMGVSKMEMNGKVRELQQVGMQWSRIVPSFCPVTGLPTHEVLKSLVEAGLTPKEIMELEYLSNKEIRDRMKGSYKPRKQTVGVLWWKKELTTHYVYENPMAAADYMRTWADMILEQEQADSPSEQGSEVHVEQKRTDDGESKNFSVGETLSKQEKMGQFNERQT